jgi:sulfate/thiosulfate transport system substrate-binding protein
VGHFERRGRSIKEAAMNRSSFITILLLGVTGLGACKSSNEKTGEPGAATEPGGATQAKAVRELDLLNVSYDPTRELWRDINEHFAAAYQKETGTQLTIKQSHGGSSTQARSVIDGLEADVLTLASYLDTDAVSKKGLIEPGWVDEFPNRSLPYTSTIIFVVRKGNPKGIKDWGDLVQPGVEVITPNPKTSGNGYLSFFAAWGSVTLRGGSREDAVKYVTQLYKQVPVLDSGARGATTTFVQKKIGDVHLAWENEAHLEVREAKGELDLVYPPISIRAEPHVAVVDGNVDRKKTRAAAEAYLKYTYTDEAQELAAKHFYRPSNETILKKHGQTFPEIKLFPVTEIAKDFADAHKQYIAEGGVFDSIYKPKN